MPLLRALQARNGIIAAELRPPRAELDSYEGMDAWIDMYHAVRTLTRQDNAVFLTDSAVGTQEENNLRHLVNNLGRDVPHERVVPFLTSKHPLAFCLEYAERAAQEGFRSLVVLGGDRTVGPPRCVEHAWQLRQVIREHVPGLSLGGWANPHADADRQAGYLADPSFHGEYFLTQVVSHHDLAAVERFREARLRHGDSLPGIFGGVKAGLALATTGAVVGEFVGARDGLGALINISRGLFDTPLMFAALITLAALTLSFYLVAVLLERALVRWEQ